MEENIYLPKDRRWNAWVKNNFEYVKSLADRIQLNPRVPEEITERFDRVKSLIKFSYFDFQLLDVASDYSLLTFEMALYHKHSSSEKNRSTKRITLDQMLDWATKNGMLDQGKEALKSLRVLRNFAAHPRKRQVLGNMAFILIQSIVDTINQLYR